MSLTPEYESNDAKPRSPEERDVRKGQIIYLQGDTEPYVVMHPTWVRPVSPDPEPQRGGWMP